MPYYYHADIRVDGMLWHHTTATVLSNMYVSLPHLVFHNYGFTLALAGLDVDPDVGYASLFNITKYKRPLDLYKRYGVYAYPLLVGKAIAKDVTMAATGEGYVTIRGRTRLAYPFFTRNIVLMPGSALTTFIISEEKMPEKLAVEIGAKRGGTLLVRLKPVNVSVKENIEVFHPFNLSDTVEVYNYTVLLKHPAGDIAVYGTASEGYSYRYPTGTRVRTFTVPVLRNI